MGATGQSITLANSIIGVGILAMPFCFQQCGVLLAALILVFMGLISRLCCYFLLKAALLARKRNFEFLAFHVFGPAGKMAVEVGIIGFLMGTCIAYFVVVGDLGPQIIAKMFNINQSDILRTSIMVVVSLVCVLPLGLLRNVDSLSNVSAATIGFYLCLVFKVIAEAATQLVAGDWHTKVVMWRTEGVLQCVPIFSMALFCQTQLFEIFKSLPMLSLEKMNVVTKNAINICTCVYFTLGLFGYIAFCSQNISGNILMSLSPTMASDVIKLGFVMSLAFSFPLVIFPCRASLYSFLYKKVHASHHDHTNQSIPQASFRCITVAIIAVALVVSLLIPNIELVLGLVGSTIGVLICVVFPAACFVNVTFKETNERVLAKGVLILGLVIMVLGTYANLQAADKLDRYDEGKITKERIDKIVEDFFEKMEKNEGTKDKLIQTDVISPISIKDEIEQVNGKQDSEVQPPNPVPPESQENNKQTDTPNDDKQIEEINPPNNELVADKVSESHPKNVQKLNIDASKEVKYEETKNNEKPKENDKPAQEKTQEKEVILKQKELIKTIQQHGEEQKELIKEQKEILDELAYLKKELKQNKKDVDSSEAKKIAVESIQKIANVAIKSLSGVSDEPIQNENKKPELHELTANEAVQEIAKKAVETIEAIKEINDKQNAIIDRENKNIASSVENVGAANQVPVVNGQPKAQSLPSGQDIQSVDQNDQLNKQIDQTVVQNDKPTLGSQQNVFKVPVQPNLQLPQIVQPSHATKNAPQITNSGKIPENQPIVQPTRHENGNRRLPSMPILQHIANQNLPIQNSNVIQPLQNANRNIQPENTNVKEPSYSPDEPHSYKEGKDIQQIQSIVKNLRNNVPIPVAMKGKIDSIESKNSNKINSQKSVNENNVNEKPIINYDVQNNGAIKSLENENKLPIRQKRDVMDQKECEKNPHVENLKTNDNYNIVEDILSSKVDLNDAILPKSLLMDAMPGHLRSLKSYDENETKR